MPSNQETAARKAAHVAARKMLAETFYVPIKTGTYFDEADVRELEEELTKYVKAIKFITTAHDEALKTSPVEGVSPFRKPRVDAPKVKAISADIFD